MLLSRSEAGRKWPRLAAPLLAVLSRTGRMARNNRKTTALILILLALMAAGAGGYAYALRQWHAAQGAVKAGRLDEAQSRLELCLAVWPRSVPVHLLAARAARLRGNFEGAEAHLNRCLKLEHGATEAIQLEYLLMRVQGGEEDEVSSELLSAYLDKNSPEAPVILDTLAHAYMHHLRYGPAFTCLSRWIEVEPDSAEPLRWRGWVRERLNDHEGAVKDYKQALQLDPELFSVRLRLAEIYLERSDPLAALPYLNSLRNQYPDRPEVLARVGQCLFLQGESEEARRLLESVVKQLPNDSVTLVHLAKLELQESHPAKAEAWLRRALQVDSTDTEAEFLLVGSLQSQGKQEEARALLKQHDRDTAALKRASQILRQEAEKSNIDPAACAEIGVLFLRSNERVGRYWLQRALERDPDNQVAHKALAEYFESKGEGQKAAVHRAHLQAEKKEREKKKTVAPS